VYGRGHHSPGLGFGPPVTPLVVKQLLIANAAVFVVQTLFANRMVETPYVIIPMIEYFGSVTPMLFWEKGYLWQPFTYMWLHGGFGHILMNCFALWMFGSQLALAWGPKRFLRYYLLCGVGAGFIIATYPYAAQVLPSVGAAGILSLTLGASGAVYGVLLAYSLTWPDRTIMLIFPPVAFRAIWLIPLLFVMTLMMDPRGNVSHVGHLGGVIVGWLYLRRSGKVGKLFTLNQLKYRWRRYRMRRKLHSVRQEEFQARRRQHDRDDHTLH
jgi:membrane associated rhomboid family serine protease